MNDIVYKKEKESVKVDHRVEYYSTDSLAREFDFGLFEQTKQRVEKKQQVAHRADERKRKAQQAQRLAAKNDVQVNTLVDSVGKKKVVRASALIGAFMIVLGMLVVNSQRLNDITTEITEKNEKLVSLEQEYEAMKVKFDSKMSDASIEEYATKVLGMQRRENNQTEWLNLDDNDLFEDCSAGREFSSSLHNSLTRIFS